MMRTVSVIVPVYNCAEYLPACIESILSQTHSDLQLILVDDGSSDGSGAICDRYAASDSRITLVHQENRGVSAARNAGLDRAAGEYLLFVDSDDLLDPRTLEAAVEAFSQPQTDLVSFKTEKFWEDHLEKMPMDTGLFDQDQMLRGILSDFAALGGGYPWNKMWRLAAFGGDVPRFREDLYFFEDLEWVVRMLLRIRRADLLDFFGYRYRVRPDSVTHKPGAQERRERGYHQSMRQVLQVLEEKPALQNWFAARYYPQVVNGVIHAHRQGWKELRGILAEKLEAWHKEILASKEISVNIKFRCRVLYLLRRVRLL